MKYHFISVSDLAILQPGKPEMLEIIYDVVNMENEEFLKIGEVIIAGESLNKILNNSCR